MAEEVKTRLFDFTNVHKLLDGFKEHSSNPLDERPRTPPSPSPLYEAHLYDPKSSAPNGLGDLDRLWVFLDKPFNTSSSRRHESVESSSSFASDKSTPPSSVPEDGPHIQELIGKCKEVRWTDEVAGINIAEIRRRRTHDSSSHLDPALKTILDDDSRSTRSRRKSRAVPHLEIAYPSEFESEAELQITKPLSSRRQRARRIVAQTAEAINATPNQVLSTTLVPSRVTPDRRPKPTHSLWVPPPIPKIHSDPSVIWPIDTLTRKEKYAKLVKKLQNAFAHEQDIIQMRYDQATKKYGGNNSPDGLHIFVDCSNIVIGFINELKVRRGINVNIHTRKAAISWHALALVLERCRPIARRVLVGSHGSPLHDHQMKRPDYMIEAENCGYEVNVLNRVLKNKDPTPTKKRGGNGNGYATTSGYSSGSDGTNMRKAAAEQAVDEVLHMKLLESLVDTQEPTTIVLASGDAAEAEYSGGFLKNVERALTKGWKVELVAWSSGLSRDYQSKEFLGRWKGRFSIILLDDFSEELLALYTNSFKAPEGVQELFA
jgi:hypothetical protein